MPKISVDALVPELIELDYRGTVYTIDPAEIDTGTTFKIQRLTARLATAELAVIQSEPGSDKDSAAIAEQEKAMLEAEQLLLGLLQKTQPDLKKVPGGVGFVNVALAQVIAQLFGGPEDPPKPARTKKATRPRKKSTPSRSSAG